MAARRKLRLIVAAATLANISPASAQYVRPSPQFCSLEFFKSLILINDVYVRTLRQFHGEDAEFLARELAFDHAGRSQVVIVSWADAAKTVFVCQQDGSWFWRDVTTDLYRAGYTTKTFPHRGDAR